MPFPFSCPVSSHPSRWTPVLDAMARAITAQRIFLKTGDYEAFLEAVVIVRRGPHRFT